MTPGAIRALGEIALRVRDLEMMTTFYRDVVGLEVLRETESAVFFTLGESHGGHTAVFVLFDRSATESAPPEAARSTLDHLAFAIDCADHDAERERLEDSGFDVETIEHVWVGWRSLYVRDPEGNLVEWVCHDPSIGTGEGE